MTLEQGIKQSVRAIAVASQTLLNVFLFFWKLGRNSFFFLLASSLFQLHIFVTVYHLFNLSFQSLACVKIALSLIAILIKKDYAEQ